MTLILIIKNVEPNMMKNEEKDRLFIGLKRVVNLLIMNSAKTLFGNNLPPLAERVRPKNHEGNSGGNHTCSEGRISQNFRSQDTILYDPVGATRNRKKTLARLGLVLLRLISGNYPLYPAV
ncbi:MAG: hypothetical protein Ct9H300mP9_7940 [Candidatus Neomarinimicrobiota bacterium]|nr:MAG: hypothetical protein Ct9H300mP9_7940 [Candidatus Neomarinimicrobiota bacterium]